MTKRSAKNAARVAVELLEGRALLTGIFSQIAQVPPALTIGPMVVSKDGNLWFSESDGSGALSLARLSGSGSKVEFPTAPSDAHGVIGGMTNDPANNVWFSLALPDGSGKVGKVAPSGHIDEFPMASAKDVPQAITSMPDGSIYVAVKNPTTGTAIQKFSSDGKAQTFPVAGADPVTWLTNGPDGNVWFVHGGKIGKMTPGGEVTEYAMPAPSDGSAVDLSNAHLTAASDGNLWFIGLGGISRISPTGDVQTLQSPGTKFTAMTVGSDGNLWFSFPPTAGSALASSPGAVVARMTPQAGLTVLPERFDEVGTTVAQMAGVNSSGVWVQGKNGVIDRIGIASVPSFSQPIIKPTTKSGVITNPQGTFSGPIASFVPFDGSPDTKVSDYKATIDWGDGHVIAGDVVPNATGGFDVRGMNTYSLPAGTFKQVIVTVRNNQGQTAVIYGGVTVAGAATLPTTTTPVATTKPTTPAATPTPAPSPGRPRGAKGNHAAVVRRGPVHKAAHPKAAVHPRGPAAHAARKKA